MDIYQVTYPTTPGSTPTVQIGARTIREARRHARAEAQARRDLTYQDIRIERRDGRLVEFAGPSR